MRITRLGEGVDAGHRLRPEALERTFAALREYRAVMDAEGVERARLVATSAVRDAANCDAFLEPAGEIVGFPAEVLTGAEEGRLSFAGATADLPGGDRSVVVLDIGGGSTEVAVDARRGGFAFDGHRVRPPDGALSEGRSSGRGRGRRRHRGDRGRARPCRAGASRARRVGPVRPPRRSRGDGLDAGFARARADPTTTGTGSTTRCFLVEAVDRWCSVLGAEPVAVRARRPAISAGREDVIFGGALILRETMRRFGFTECIVSEADILDGLVQSDTHAGRGRRRLAGATGKAWNARRNPSGAKRPGTHERDMGFWHIGWDAKSPTPAPVAKVGLLPALIVK